VQSTSEVYDGATNYQEFEDTDERSN